MFRTRRTVPVCILFFFFWPHHAAFGIVVPWPGIKPGPPAVEARSPNHWTAREFPQFTFLLTVYGVSFPVAAPVKCVDIFLHFYWFSIWEMVSRCSFKLHFRVELNKSFHMFMAIYCKWGFVYHYILQNWVLCRYIKSIDFCVLILYSTTSWIFYYLG